MKVLCDKDGNLIKFRRILSSIQVQFEIVLSWPFGAQTIHGKSFKIVDKVFCYGLTPIDGLEEALNPFQRPIDHRFSKESDSQASLNH